jgi:hypothetical protein
MKSLARFARHPICIHKLFGGNYSLICRRVALPGVYWCEGSRLALAFGALPFSVLYIHGSDFSSQHEFYRAV